MELNELRNETITTYALFICWSVCGLHATPSIALTASNLQSVFLEGQPVTFQAAVYPPVLSSGAGASFSISPSSAALPNTGSTGATGSTFSWGTLLMPGSSGNISVTVSAMWNTALEGWVSASTTVSFAVTVPRVVELSYLNNSGNEVDVKKWPPGSGNVTDPVFIHPTGSPITKNDQAAYLKNTVPKVEQNITSNPLLDVAVNCEIIGEAQGSAPGYTKIATTFPAYFSWGTTKPVFIASAPVMSRAGGYTPAQNTIVWKYRCGGPAQPMSLN